MFNLFLFLRLNTLTCLNWILTEQTHSPTRLSLWHLGTGTLFLRPSSQRHITFNPPRHASTNTFDSDPIPKYLIISIYKGLPRTTIQTAKTLFSVWFNLKILDIDLIVLIKYYFLLRKSIFLSPLKYFYRASCFRYPF